VEQIPRHTSLFFWLRAEKAPQTFPVKPRLTRETTFSRQEPASFAQKANSLSIKFSSLLPIAVIFLAFKTAN
jgi:hypothetical protein